MVARLVTGLLLLVVIKVAARYVFIGPFTPAAVFLFSIVDTAMTIVLTPWASMGQPQPQRKGIYLRALMVAATSTVVLALVNTALQVPTIYNASTDITEAAVRVALDSLPRSFFINPLGGLAATLIASGLGWGWMRIRLPKGPTAHAGAGGHSRAAEGTRAAPGPGSHTAPPRGARRPR